MPRLENWSLCFNDMDSFKAPELRNVSLYGEIYDDDRFVTGHHIRTSTVIELNLEDKYAQTRNTLYKLGKTNPEYIQWLKDNNFDSYKKLEI